MPAVGRSIGCGSSPASTGRRSSPPRRSRLLLATAVGGEHRADAPCALGRAAGEPTAVRPGRANAAATQRRSRPRAEADKAKAVNAFLTEDLLTQAEPANTAAEDHVSLLDVLDRAAAKVGDRFAGQPEVEDALRRTMAGTYHGLASWEKAEQQWRAVLALGAARSGPGEPRSTYRPQRAGAHPPSSRPARRRGAGDGEVRQRRPGPRPRPRSPRHAHQPQLPRPGLLPTPAALPRPSHSYEANLKADGVEASAPTTQHAHHPPNLASSTSPPAAPPRPSRWLEATLKLRSRSSAPTTQVRSPRRNILAYAYLAVGRIAEAIKLGEATLKLNESKLGPRHPDTLTSRNNLAVGLPRRRPHRRGHHDG